MNVKTQYSQVMSSSILARLVALTGGVLIALIVLTVGNFAVYLVTDYDVFMSLARGGAVAPPAGQVEFTQTFISDGFRNAAFLFIVVLIAVLAGVATSYIDALIRRRHSDNA